MSARKSKRRSSFAAGRIKLQHGGALGGELHTQIDSEKPQEERLAILTRECLQFTLQKLEEEMSEIQDFQSLKKEVEDAVLRSIAEMEETGVFQKACNKDNYLQNPINLEMDDAIDKLEEQTKKLHEEADKWDSMVNEVDNLLTQNDVQDFSEDSIPVHIKSQATDYLCQKIDYNDLCKHFQQSVIKTKLLIDEHARAVNLLKQTHSKADEIIQGQTNKLQKDSLSDINSTPRKLIKNLMALPSPE